MNAALAIGSDGVGVLTLDRPGFGNAFDLGLAVEFNARVLECEGRDDLRALILYGADGTFCVGGDLRYIQEADADRGAALRRLVDVVHCAVRRLRALDTPVIAAVEGAAAGVGLSLVCLSDYAIAAEGSSFTVAYSAVGLSPDGGCSWTLPRVVGRRVAADMALTNRRVGAEEARETGLVTEVAPAGGALDRARDVAARIARFPVGAVAATRQLLLEGGDRAFDAQLELEARTISHLAAQPDSVAAIEKFLERSTAGRDAG